MAVFPSSSPPTVTPPPPRLADCNLLEQGHPRSPRNVRSRRFVGGRDAPQQAGTVERQAGADWSSEVENGVCRLQRALPEASALRLSLKRGQWKRLFSQLKF